MAASSSSPDDRRRKSERQSWADMADSPRQPDGVQGAIDPRFFQTLAITPLGHRQTVARGICLSSRGSGYCRMWGRRMVLEGDGFGGGWARFSFPFFRPFRREASITVFRVTRAGPEPLIRLNPN